MRFSQLLLSLLAITGLSTTVDAHAKLVSPQAWNAQPSKTPVCGVAQSAAAANPANFKATYVDPTQPLLVQWTVVVGDGTGDVTVTMDTTAKVNPGAADFTTTLTPVVGNPKPSAVGPYTLKYTIPSTTVCTGPKGTCTLRFSSSSNWVACATITVAMATDPPVVTQAPTTQAPVTQAPTTKTPTTAAPTQAGSTPAPTTQAPVTQAPATQAPTTATPTSAADTPAPTKRPANDYLPYPSVQNNCVNVTGLTTCAALNGQYVQLLGVDAATVEQSAVDQIEFSLANPAVLTTPTEACRKSYTSLICAQSFPLCQATALTVCQSTCMNVNAQCAPNATVFSGGGSHADLYKCDASTGFNTNTRDAGGKCLTVNNTATRMATNHFMIAIMAIVTVFTAAVAQL